jgi:nucleotide-binding universal stress UspA family protein
MSVKLLEGGCILVPVDGSEHSDVAVSHAIDLAKKYSAKVRLVYVLSTPAFILNQDIDEEITIVDIEERLEQSGQALLDKFFSRAEHLGITITTKLLKGHLGRQIVQYAKAEGFNLIVIGSSGRSAVSKYLLGSVCDYVTKHVECPVLIIK